MPSKTFATIVGILWLAAVPVAAKDIADSALAVDSSSLDDDADALYGAACEKIRPQEAKSSVRLRATDKASFEAVKNLSELDDFRKKAGEHDFNVLVYNIVDNYVEDLAVRTTKQNDSEICVEVTGYVKKADLKTATVPSDEASQETTIVSELNADEVLPEAGEMSGETEEDSSVLEVAVSQPKSSSPLSQEEIIAETSDENSAPQKLLYIAPVAFFNNTVSENHKQILKEIFDKNDAFYLTENKETADYIVSAKVMRAKVDPINSNTNRLQMVLSVGVEFTDSGASTVEHQNRFILFSSDDNEQDVAAKLMRKLLTKAGEQILNKVEADIQRSEASGKQAKIITPK